MVGRAGLIATVTAGRLGPVFDAPAFQKANAALSPLLDEVLQTSLFQRFIDVSSPLVGGAIAVDAAPARIKLFDDTMAHLGGLRGMLGMAASRPTSAYAEHFDAGGLPPPPAAAAPAPPTGPPAPLLPPPGPPGAPPVVHAPLPRLRRFEAERFGPRRRPRRQFVRSLAEEAAIAAWARKHVAARVHRCGALYWWWRRWRWVCLVDDVSVECACVQGLARWRA